MNSCLIMTIIGPDRSGLVQELAELIVKNGGNWQESRMVHLEGQFAGVVHITVQKNQSKALIEAIRTQAPTDLKIELVEQDSVQSTEQKTIRIELIANDRQGIISELSAVIAKVGANIEELETCIENAAHAGLALFKAEGIISLPSGLTQEALVDELEQLSPDLQVSIL